MKAEEIAKIRRYVKRKKYVGSRQSKDPARLTFNEQAVRRTNLSVPFLSATTAVIGIAALVTAIFAFQQTTSVGMVSTYDGLLWVAMIILIGLFVASLSLKEFIGKQVFGKSWNGWLPIGRAHSGKIYLHWVKPEADCFECAKSGEKIPLELKNKTTYVIRASRWREDVVHADVKDKPALMCPRNPEHKFFIWGEYADQDHLATDPQKD